MIYDPGDTAKGKLEDVEADMDKEERAEAEEKDEDKSASNESSW